MTTNARLKLILILLSCADDDRTNVAEAMLGLLAMLIKGEDYPDVHKCVTEWLDNETDKAWIQFAEKLRSDSSVENLF